MFSPANPPVGGCTTVALFSAVHTQLSTTQPLPGNLSHVSQKTPVEQAMWYLQRLRETTQSAYCFAFQRQVLWGGYVRLSHANLPHIRHSKTVANDLIESLCTDEGGFVQKDLRTLDAGWRQTPALTEEPLDDLFWLLWAPRLPMTEYKMRQLAYAHATWRHLPTQIKHMRWKQLLETSTSGEELRTLSDSEDHTRTQLLARLLMTG
jgi:hypothetical protein